VDDLHVDPEIDGHGLETVFITGGKGEAMVKLFATGKSGIAPEEVCDDYDRMLTVLIG
jgi:hypothetical protein